MKPIHRRCLPALSRGQRLVSLFLLVMLLSGCGAPAGAGIATPLPPDYIPTAAALTLAARGIGAAAPTPAETSAPLSTASGLPQPASTTAAPTFTAVPPTTTPIPPTDTLTPPPSDTPLPPPSATPTASAPPLDTATQPAPSPTQAATLPPGPTAWPTLVFATPGLNTPAPPIPEARIQIYQLGERSKLISPIDVTTRLTTSKSLVVRIELYGEDGRVLARHVRTYSQPWEANKIGTRLEFEVSGAGELGRLVVSVEDQYNRLIEVNSVDLLLLAQGKNEFNPASTLWQRIVIEEPQPKALIQGGTLIATGRALPFTSQPLKVMLVAEDGRVLGQRLAGVNLPIPGDYGYFITEVPYTVSEITPALLVIYEDGGLTSPIALLSSIPVTLAP